MKIDIDESANPNEIGRIVITDLFNKAFPMIRYDTGDLGIYDLVNEEVVIKKIYGRKLDNIYDPKGNIINPHSIARGIKLVLNSDSTKQWQLIQKSSNSFVLKLSLKRKLKQEEKNNVINILKKTIDEDIHVNIVVVNEIPVLNSQKRQYVINEINKLK